jgi:hypothetical protein
VKVYILKESDFESLRAAIVADPKRAERGTGGRTLTEEERVAYDDAYRFHNYQICNWIDAMKRDAT